MLLKYSKRNWIWILSNNGMIWFYLLRYFQKWIWCIDKRVFKISKYSNNDELNFFVFYFQKRHFKFINSFKTNVIQIFSLFLKWGHPLNIFLKRKKSLHHLFLSFCVLQEFWTRFKCSFFITSFQGQIFSAW